MAEVYYHGEALTYTHRTTVQWAKGEVRATAAAPNDGVVGVVTEPTPGTTLEEAVLGLVGEYSGVKKTGGTNSWVPGDYLYMDTVTFGLDNSGGTNVVAGSRCVAVAASIEDSASVVGKAIFGVFNGPVST